MTLTSSHQGMSPSAGNFATKATEPLQITVYCVVIEITLYHLSQPLAYRGNGFMASPHHGFS
jgi:hypothetical protein